jgi:hypothetical protein
MTVWKQQRPDWCPHQDCAYRASSQGCICIGELPEPTPHLNSFNTHRLCIAQSCPGDDEWLFKLEINSGDANGIARVLGRVFGFKPVASGMSAGTAETQSGSGRKPASPTAESRDAQTPSGDPR